MKIEFVYEVLDSVECIALFETEIAAVEFMELMRLDDPECDLRMVRRKLVVFSNSKEAYNAL